MTKKVIKEISVPIEKIANKIYLIREHSIMLDRYLARLYGVETKVLKQAVRRNIDRFPGDFMFELTDTELKKLEVTICDLQG
jgi:aromatic ring-opening dioxygenase LigB subunit